MKRLILVLLLLPIVQGAYDQVIYDDWAKSGEYFSIDNESYRMIWIRSSNTTVVYFPHGLTSVIYPWNATCVKEWIYSVCQFDQKFEKDGEVVPQEINDPYIDVFMKIRINKTEIALEHERTPLAAEYFVGDRVRLQSDITKVGDEDITNISYLDQYDHHFQISPVHGCVVRDRSLVWKGDMNQSNKHLCIYDLTFSRPTEYTNNLTLSYDVLGKRQTIEKQYDILVKERPLLLTVNHTNLSRHTEENFTINISLVALQTVNVDDFRVNYPEQLRIAAQSEEFIDRQGYLQFRQEMEPGDGANLSVTFMSVLQGNFSVGINAHYVYDNKVDTIRKNFDTIYEAERLHVSLHIVDGESVLRLHNPGMEYLRDIEVSVLNYTFEHDRLNHRSFTEYTFPAVPNDTYAVDVTYRTMHGQILEDTYHLRYGTASFDKPLPEEEEDTTHQDDADDQDEAGNYGPWLTYAAIAVGAVMVLGILVFIIISIKGKFGKSGIEKDIEKLKKKHKEEPEEQEPDEEPEEEELEEVEEDDEEEEPEQEDELEEPEDDDDYHMMVG